MTNDLAFVDFISVLPLEISTQILLALNSAEQEWNSIWQCLVVSKSWRMLILGMPIWKAVQLGNGKYDTDVVCSIIPVFMPKVEELKLGYIPDDIFYRCLACLETGQIPSLKSLTLEGHTADLLCSDRALQRLDASRMLTHLNVKDYRDQQMVQPPSISTAFSVCENLTYLAYETGGWLYFPKPLLRPTNIVHLELRYRLVIQSHLQRILQYCPNLRSLLVDQCRESSMLSMIRQTCPNLFALNYNMCSFGDHKLLLVDDADNDASAKIRGLRHFYVGNAEAHATFPYNMKEALAYMVDSCSTLQKLIINASGDEDFEYAPHFDRTDVIFSNLHTIHCYDAYMGSHRRYDYASLIAEIITRSPQLEHLEIELFESVLTPVFETLVNNANNLRELNLAVVCLSDCEAAFFAFTDRQATRPTVRKVTFRQCDGFSDIYLARLAPINTIRSLCFIRQDAITPYGLIKYASMGPALEDLKIQDMAISRNKELDTVLHSIAQLKVLKSVSVIPSTVDTTVIPCTGLKYLVQHSRSIKSIRVNEFAMKEWRHKYPKEAQDLSDKSRSAGIFIAGL